MEVHQKEVILVEVGVLQMEGVVHLVEGLPQFFLEEKQWVLQGPVGAHWEKLTLQTEVAVHQKEVILVEVGVLQMVAVIHPVEVLR